jgi:hypothetical protein
VWAANFAAGFLIKGYEPDQAINAVFMAIVGGLFALDRRGTDKNGKNDDKDSSNSGGHRDG